MNEANPVLPQFLTTSSCPSPKWRLPWPNGKDHWQASAALVGRALVVTALATQEKERARPEATTRPP